MTEQLRAMTRTELQGLDGNRGPAHVAFEGRVFDVSDSPEWRRGLHRGLHWAGQDLTAYLSEAPHGVETLLRFPEVGYLVDRSATATERRPSDKGAGDA